MTWTHSGVKKEEGEHNRNDHARFGYNVGREWYFVESLIEQPDERTYTDASLLERLQEIERESVYFQRRGKHMVLRAWL